MACGSTNVSNIPNFSNETRLCPVSSCSNKPMFIQFLENHMKTVHPDYKVPSHDLYMWRMYSETLRILSLAKKLDSSAKDRSTRSKCEDNKNYAVTLLNCVSSQSSLCLKFHKSAILDRQIKHSEKKFQKRKRDLNRVIAESSDCPILVERNSHVQEEQPITLEEVEQLTDLCKVCSVEGDNDLYLDYKAKQDHAQGHLQYASHKGLAEQIKICFYHVKDNQSNSNGQNVSRRGRGGRRGRGRGRPSKRGRGAIANVNTSPLKNTRARGTRSTRRR